MEYQGQTDNIKEIELDSTLEQVQWTRPSAVPQAIVGLDIYTRFIGNGAEMNIELTDQSGKNFGVLKEKILGNRFRTDIKIPEKARDVLYAEVKLPKHGLSKKSPPLVIKPPVKIKNVRWDKDVVHRGEVVKLSADIEGVQDGTEVEVSIWEHDEDGAHSHITEFTTTVENGRVEIEWEYDYFENTEEIPRDEEVEGGYHAPEYFFRVEVHGLTAESGVLEFKDSIKIELVNIFGEPIPNQAYLLYAPDGVQREGELDDEGQAGEEDVPPGPYRVEFPDLD